MKQHSSHLRKIGACLRHHILNLRKEFITDSGASIDMISKKNLNSAEMDTLEKSCSPTIVITANGEVQTHEEVTVYVKELVIFLTMKVLDNTPAVLSFGKLCHEHGYSCEWVNGQKPHLIKKRYADTVQHGERRSDRGSWFVNKFFLQCSLFNIHDTFKAGDWSSYVFLDLVYFTNHNCVKRQWDLSKGRSEWDRFLSSICVKWTCWMERTGRPVDQANPKSQTK